MRNKLIITLAVIIGIGLGGTGMLVLARPAAGAGCSPSAASATHNVMIMDSSVEPAHVTAKRCDTITFTNMDSVAREIAFGPHENHVPYDGIAEKVLNTGESFTITLNQVGSFRWHDHLHDSVQGTFVVQN